jgi:glutamate racemase
MPWGSRHPDDITERLLCCAQASLRYEPDVLICASNTGSVHALDVLTAELGAEIPVVGTLPPVRKAAAAGEPIAVWATIATTASRCLADLIDRYASPGQVTAVGCRGLAEAVETGEGTRIAAAISDALAGTPERVEHIVLGCTQYELAAPHITAIRPGLRLHGAASSVASEAFRRVQEARRETGRMATDRRNDAGRRLHVLLSGREGALPASALQYAEGNLVAAMTHDGSFSASSTGMRP